MMRRFLVIMIAMLCCGWVSAQSYHIGDLYTAPNGSQGIVYYIHPDGSGGWVVALNDASTGCAWGNATDVPNLIDQNPSFDQQLLNDTAGYANTQIIRAYQNSNSAYAAGVVDFVHGWVLPSPAQLSMLYGQLPFVSTALTRAGGTDLARDFYWCSGERDANNAWSVNFGTFSFSGYADGIAKTTSCRVRAVRSFSATTVVYDTTLTYLWNTGSTQPHIDVSPGQTTTYTVTATTEFGCSNTAEQTILVGNNMPQILYDTVCQGAGYEANGFSLTAEETATAGTVERTRTMETSGCSSTLTLFLTVNPAVAELVEVAACDSYTWNGITYTESGDYTLTYNSSQGCDSVVTLRLTVNPSPEVTVAATADTICLGESVTLQAATDAPLVEEPPLPVPPVAVGDILCTDNCIVKSADFAASGKTAKGVVFYVDNTGVHGWAVHLQDQAQVIAWCPANPYIDVSTLTNITTIQGAINDFDGYGHTQRLRMAGTAATFPVAYAVNFAQGWYIPAIGQLNVLFADFPKVNESLQTVGGSPLFSSPFASYWSSSEYSDFAAYTILGFGVVHPEGKAGDVSLRSVVDF